MLTSTQVRIRQQLEQVFERRQAEVLAEVVETAYADSSAALTASLVKTSDFNELKQIVKELAQGQRELTQAQQRTELRVEELAQAQQRTETAVRQLAEEQRKLVQEHAETRRQLGGLSATVGYTLENEAFKALPALLARDYGLTVSGRLTRGYVTNADGQPLEINVLGQATRGEERLTIVGESKVQLSTNKIDRFIRDVLQQLRPDVGAVFPVLVTHMVSAPDVEAYARQQGIAVYYSYDF